MHTWTLFDRAGQGHISRRLSGSIAGLIGARVWSVGRRLTAGGGRHGVRLVCGTKETPLICLLRTVDWIAVDVMKERGCSIYLIRIEKKSPICVVSVRTCMNTQRMPIEEGKLVCTVLRRLKSLPLFVCTYNRSGKLFHIKFKSPDELTQGSNIRLENPKADSTAVQLLFRHFD